MHTPVDPAPSGHRADAAMTRYLEAAVRLTAIANLPIGWLFEDQRRERDDLVLRATGPDGGESEVAGATAEEAWFAMAESLAALGEGPGQGHLQCDRET